MRLPRQGGPHARYDYRGLRLLVVRRQLRLQEPVQQQQAAAALHEQPDKGSDQDEQGGHDRRGAIQRVRLYGR